MKRTSNTTRSETSSNVSNRTKSPTSNIESQDRITFPKGGKRDDKGRPYAFHLLCPAALNAYAMVCKEGSLKYGDRNWEKGIPTENYIDHALQHLVAVMQEVSTGMDTGNKKLNAFGEKVESLHYRLTELSHALWNIAAAIHNESECQHHDWEA